MIHCDKRQRVVKFEADGSKAEAFFCNAPESELHGEEVTVLDCDKCPVRAAINQQAITRMGRRTPQLAGELKREPDNKQSAYVPCDSRIVATVRVCCGLTDEIRICDHRACSRYGSEVTEVICEYCPLRAT